MSKPKVARDIQIPINVLKELLTPSELRMLKNRFQIIHLLEGGLPIRQIAEKIKVGTDTVVRVARMLERGNLRKALDEQPGLKKISSNKWIFGKSED